MILSDTTVSLCEKTCRSLNEIHIATLIEIIRLHTPNKSFIWYGDLYKAFKSEPPYIIDKVTCDLSACGLISNSHVSATAFFLTKFGQDFCEWFAEVHGNENLRGSNELSI